MPFANSFGNVVLSTDGTGPGTQIEDSAGNVILGCHQVFAVEVKISGQSRELIITCRNFRIKERQPKTETPLESGGYPGASVSCG